jgi:hypothetical protein
VNPFNPALSYAVSSFDVKQNFVLSYEYQLPVDRYLHPNRLTRGWSLSGITRFATGFPITMINNGDNSLIGTNPNGVNNSSIDEPDYNGAPLHLNRNPAHQWEQLLQRADFTMNALGDPGHIQTPFLLRPRCGELRYGARQKVYRSPIQSPAVPRRSFNVFNHTQFNGPASVDGNIGSSTFGNAISAAAPRILPRILHCIGIINKLRQ